MGCLDSPGYLLATRQLCTFFCTASHEDYRYMANAADSGVAQSIKVGAVTHALGKYEALVKAELETLTSTNFAKRLWEKDASLWTGNDESQWLGWLDIVKEQLANLPKLAQL